MIPLSTIFIKKPGDNFKTLGMIRCAHCDHLYPMPEFHKAVFLYGVYFLVSPTDGYLGTKCINPNCTRTLSFKGTREEIDHFKNEILFYLDLGSFQLQPDFRYHSPLKWSPDQYPHLKQFDIMHSTWGTVRLDAETVDMSVTAHEQKESYLLDEYYNSYVAGCGEPIGNTLSVWWFKKEQVENLIRIEDIKQIRIFPRYMLFDPLYLEACSFCWNYHFAQKFYGDMTLPTAAQINPGNKDKKAISKNFDFASILEFAPYAAVGEAQMALSLPGHSFSWLKNSIDKLNNESELMQPRLIENEKMIDELWSNYHTQYMQEQLTTLSTDFLFEYIEAVQRTNFSYASLWDLKSNYLKSLYETCRSRRKKAINKKIAREKIKKLVEKECPAFQKIISVDDNINQTKFELTKLASSPRKNKVFLLLGESGTGKTLFAKGIHDASMKEEAKPFVKLNCANIPETLLESELFGYKKGSHHAAGSDKQGLFVTADGGTIFLDEIGNLSIENQKKLLTVLDGDERTFFPLGANAPVTVEVTTVLATNEDLAEKVEKGEFLFVLYMRIKGLDFPIPPLRDRAKEDFELLIEKLIKQEAEKNKTPSLESIGVTADAFDMLVKHPWPGNVRELENLISRIIMLRNEDDTSDISVNEIQQKISVHPQKANKENKILPKFRAAPDKRILPPWEVIDDLLQQNGGKISRVAKLIGVTREHLSRELSKRGPL